MVVLIEMISNWVAWSVVANGCLMVVDSKSELCTSFTDIIALSVTTFIAFYKYTTLGELHENDPGLTIDVVPGSVRDGLVSMKLHILHLLSSHLEFPCNVVVVLLTVLWIKLHLGLGGCLNVVIGGVLSSYLVDGFSSKFLHAFLMSRLNF